jgi:hypothetical protein
LAEHISGAYDKEKVLVFRFVVFTAVKINILIVWVMTPSSPVCGYQSFRRECCLILGVDCYPGDGGRMFLEALIHTY